MTCGRGVRGALSVALLVSTALLLGPGLSPGAQAAGPVQSLQLTPASPSSASGTCTRFTLTASDAGSPAQRVPGADLAVTLTEASDPANQQDADFCQTTTPAQGAVAAPADVTRSGGVTYGRFSTDSAGQVSFGVVTTLPGNAVTVRAFHDVNGDRMFTAGEPTDSATLTTTPGARPNDPNAAPDAIVTVTASPSTQRAIVGETATVTAVVKNANGNNVVGVRPRFDVTAGANSAVGPADCTVTDNEGAAACTYVAAAQTTGTADSIRVWVNQTDGSGPGYDSGNEPTDTAAVTVAGRPTKLQIDLACTTAAPQDTSAEDCVNYTSSGVRDFIARVTAPDGPDAGTSRDAASDVGVRFQLSGSTTASLSVSDCLTDTTGACSVRVTETAARVGKVLTVTATVRGQDPAGDPGDGEVTVDSGTFSFTNLPEDARNLTLSPDGAATPPGGVREFQALVIDVSGGPVRGVTVTFTEEGAGRFVTGASSVTAPTGSDGIARAEVTSQPVESGSQTITATISSPRNSGSGNDQCEAPAGKKADGTVVAGAPAGNCTATVHHSFGGSTTPGPTVTLSTSSVRITAGNTPLLAGRALDASGNPIGNAPVTLYAKGYGDTAYTALTFDRPLTTAPDGRFSALVRPYRQTVYRAQVGSTQSPQFVVFVNGRVNVAGPVPGATVSRSAVFTGDLDPDFASVEVGLALLGRDAAGRLTFRVIGVTVTNAAGAFRLTAPGGLPLGTNGYAVFTSAHQGADRGSKSLTLTVR